MTTATATRTRSAKAKKPNQGGDHIVTGSNYKPLKKYRGYKFDSLKKKGDFFMVKDFGSEKSVRVQASRQSRRRGVVYRVQKTEMGIVVYHDGNIP